MWKEVIFYREKYHVLQRQHQEVLQAHSACASGPPEQPYIHLLQELEKLQDMYRHILGQNTTLKFEVQRLMQQCVNAGLIPPPKNYIVTPIPALQPVRKLLCPIIVLQFTLAIFSRQCNQELYGGSPSPQLATNKFKSRSSTARCVPHIQDPTLISFSHLQKAAHPGPVARQFASSPSNPYTTNHVVANTPAIVAGPIQAYNYHRAQFPQSQQPAAQLMPPPRPPGQFFSSQQIPATRPRQIVDLTNSDDERVPKRPRMASDPNVYTQNSPGPVTHLRHQAYAQMPAPAPYQVLQERNLHPRAQMAAVDHMQTQFSQQYHSQRPGPTNSYQQFSPPPPPTNAGHYRVTGEQGATQIPSNLPNGQVQGFGQPGQAYTDLPHSANIASPTSDAGTTHTETPAERSTGTPVGSTAATAPLDSSRVTKNGHMHGGELPLLTEEQSRHMRSEVADSMFTEPQEGEQTQARTCMLCK